MSEDAGGRRDDEALAAGLGRFFSAHPELVPRPDSPGSVGAGLVPSGEVPAIQSLVHAEGGMANETVLVDFGPGHAGVVVRLPPIAPTFPHYDLAPQALVQTVVAAGESPPRPRPWRSTTRPGSVPASS